MKIGSITKGYQSVNFGRSLNNTEIEGAYKAARDARTAMGLQNGNGVLLLPSEKLPVQSENTVNIKEQIANFFEKAKKLLGINAIELEGSADEAVKTPLDEAFSQTGLKKIVKFTAPAGDRDALLNAVQNAAQDADGLRIVNPQSISEDDIKAIENKFREIKGDKFDPQMLMYEHGMEAYDWNSGKIAKKYDGRTIISSSMDLNDDGGVLWGSKSFLTDRMGAKQGSFIHGIRMEGQPDLNSQMYNNDQIHKGLRLLETELKLQDDDLELPERFAAAKRADVALSQNFYKHFNDIAPGADINIQNFDTIYQQALQEGRGDNYFDSLAKAMKAMGLNESAPETYETICKYRNALFSKGAIDADEVAKLTQEQLEQAYKDVSNVVLQGTAVKAQKLEAQNEAKKAMEALAAEIAKFGEHDSAKLQEAKNMKKSMNPLDKTNFDRILNAARKHKVPIIAAAIIAAAGAVGFTMYSYGKEIAQKQSQR